MIRVVPGCIAALCVGAAHAEPVVVRPPQTEVSVELGAADPPAELQIFWTCFATDLATAARAVVAGHAAEPDCEAITAGLAAGERRFAEETEAAAGGRVLERDAPRVVDPEPGQTESIEAQFCYAADDLVWVEDWTRRRLAALCDIDLPEPGAPARRSNGAFSTVQP